MLVKNKYEYPILERVDMEIGRHYLDSNNKPVPSVTTILSGTSKSKDGLIPNNIPANPRQKYKDKGWKGYKDWLGTEEE